MACQSCSGRGRVALVRIGLASIATTIAALGTGCGSSQAHTPQAVPAAGAATTNNATTQVCPTTFAAASGSCAASVHCDYPEGQCNCAYQVVCHGGARMPPPRSPPSPPPLVWKCAPTPPTVRPDGCPGVRPGETTCAVERQRCDYAEVCFTGSTAICTNGRWLLTPWPPPP
jgi:hypothetical protein